MASELVAAFIKIGLTEQRAKETAKNEALSQTLKQLIIEVNVFAGMAFAILCSLALIQVFGFHCFNRCNQNTDVLITSILGHCDETMKSSTSNLASKTINTPRWECFPVYSHVVK